MNKFHQTTLRCHNSTATKPPVTAHQDPPLPCHKMPLCSQSIKQIRPAMRARSTSLNIPFYIDIWMTHLNMLRDAKSSSNSNIIISRVQSVQQDGGMDQAQDLWAHMTMRMLVCQVFHHIVNRPMNLVNRAMTSAMVSSAFLITVNFLFPRATAWFIFHCIYGLRWVKLQCSNFRVCTDYCIPALQRSKLRSQCVATQRCCEVWTEFYWGKMVDGQLSHSKGPVTRVPHKPTYEENDLKRIRNERWQRRKITRTNNAHHRMINVHSKDKTDKQRPFKG